MTDTKIEKLNTSPDAAATEAGTDAAASAASPSAAGDRELSDQDVERVSGGAADAEPRPPVRPAVRAL
jgi:hypothetical protein